MATPSLRRLIGAPVRGALARLGYELHRAQPATGDVEHVAPDIDDHARSLFQTVRPYTLTNIERVTALRDAVRYISRAGIPGDVAECGVWRGGSMMVIARTLVELEDTARTLYLFDTFTRPPDPGPNDGEGAREALHADLQNPGYAYLPIVEVRALIESTGYPKDHIVLVQGLVEDTIPEHAPDGLALVRLDTDYYSSTAHEMRHLYPRLAAGGVLLIDDYGAFVGAKQAVDEFFESTGQVVLLNRIDATGRLVVAPTPASR